MYSADERELSAAWRAHIRSHTQPVTGWNLDADDSLKSYTTLRFKSFFPDRDVNTGQRGNKGNPCKRALVVRVNLAAGIWWHTSMSQLNLRASFVPDSVPVVPLIHVRRVCRRLSREALSVPSSGDRSADSLHFRPLVSYIFGRPVKWHAGAELRRAWQRIEQWPKDLKWCATRWWLFSLFAVTSPGQFMATTWGVCHTLDCRNWDSHGNSLDNMQLQHLSPSIMLTYAHAFAWGDRKYSPCFRAHIGPCQRNNKK